MRLSRVVAVLVLALPVTVAAQDAPVTVRAARVLDGRGNVLRDATVTVRDGKIVSVKANAAGPAMYDLGDMTLMPGLIDAHAHIGWYFNSEGRLHRRNDGDGPGDEALAGAANAWATLRAGFTLVQSPGSPSDAPLRDAIAAGGVPGPQVLTSLSPLGDESLSPDSLRALVRARKQQGADLIKIFASASIRDGGAQTMSDEQLEAACGEAKAQGLRTLVHAHSDAAVRAAVLAGCTQVEHGVFTADSTLALMVQHHTYFDPQCSLVFRNYLDNRPKYEGIGNYNEEGFASMEKAIPLAIAGTRKAVNTPGLVVVYGTDAVAGAHGHNAEDLVCRVRQAGQSPMDAIVSATSVNAEALGMADEIGSIAPGLRANIMAVAGDPLERIEAIRDVHFVMKDGVVYRNDAAPAATQAVGR